MARLIVLLLLLSFSAFSFTTEIPECDCDIRDGVNCSSYVIQDNHYSQDHPWAVGNISYRTTSRFGEVFVPDDPMWIDYYDTDLYHVIGGFAYGCFDAQGYQGYYNMPACWLGVKGVQGQMYMMVDHLDYCFMSQEWYDCQFFEANRDPELDPHYSMDWTKAQGSRCLQTWDVPGGSSLVGGSSAVLGSSATNLSFDIGPIMSALAEANSRASDTRDAIDRVDSDVKESNGLLGLIKDWLYSLDDGGVVLSAPAGSSSGSATVALPDGLQGSIDNMRVSFSRTCPTMPAITAFGATASFDICSTLYYVGGVHIFVLIGNLLFAVLSIWAVRFVYFGD